MWLTRLNTLAQAQEAELNPGIRSVSLSPFLYYVLTMP